MKIKANCCSDYMIFCAYSVYCVVSFYAFIYLMLCTYSWQFRVCTLHA